MEVFQNLAGQTEPMSIFPSSKHLASWAGLAPGNHESAGKNYHARIRKGNAYLKKVLTSLGQNSRRDKNRPTHFWVGRKFCMKMSFVPASSISIYCKLIFPLRLVLLALAPKLLTIFSVY
ncbi:IS110 family transposase [Paenilisteria rocourtiae]|uniref:IS110 family transposase n=1 Tax=Listeria rocourtiae TaxID=647910 RepID=UPI00244515F4|nr:IS110 family transposase [Listeria rocourtiae]